MYVYIIQSGNKPKHPVKIGMSDNPEGRVKQLQTGNPVELRLLVIFKCDSRAHAFNLEHTLHKLLNSRHISGEWFSVSKSNIYKTINSIANNPDIKRVSNEDGLFSKGKPTLDPEDDRIKCLMRKIEARDIQIDELIEKGRKRKLEAGFFRSKLSELGFDCKNVDSLIGRK